MKTESKFKENLNRIVSGEKSDWEEKAKWRVANKNWLLKSAAIALKISKTLKEQNITQAELAQKLGSSAQHVSKIIKGQENLTLETISKLEGCLGVELISVPKYLISLEVEILHISLKDNFSAQPSYKSIQKLRVREDRYEIYNSALTNTSFLQTA